MKQNVITSCQSKRSYKIREAADKTAEYLLTKFVQVKSYRCGICEMFHLTGNMKGKR